MYCSFTVLNWVIIVGATILMKSQWSICCFDVYNAKNIWYFSCLGLWRSWHLKRNAMKLTGNLFLGAWLNLFWTISDADQKYRWTEIGINRGKGKELNIYYWWNKRNSSRGNLLPTEPSSSLSEWMHSLPNRRIRTIMNNPPSLTPTSLYNRIPHQPSSLSFSHYHLIILSPHFGLIYLGHILH